MSTALLASASLAMSTRACGGPPEQRLAGFAQLLGGLHIGECSRELLQPQQRGLGQAVVVAVPRAAAREFDA